MGNKRISRKYLGPAESQLWKSFSTLVALNPFFGYKVKRIIHQHADLIDLPAVKPAIPDKKSSGLRRVVKLIKETRVKTGWIAVKPLDRFPALKKRYIKKGDAGKMKKTIALGLSKAAQTAKERKKSFFKLANRKIDRILEKLPNRMRKTLAGSYIGYTIGGTLGVISLLVGGPFAPALLIFGFGVSFVVFGFLLDIATEGEKVDKKLEDREATPLLAESVQKSKIQQATDRIAKGFGLVKGLKLVKRKVYEPVMKKMPNRLSNTINMANQGYSIGWIVGSIFSFAVGGPFGLSIWLGLFGVYFIYGFALDVKAELDKKKNIDPIPLKNNTFYSIWNPLSGLKAIASHKVTQLKSKTNKFKDRIAKSFEGIQATKGAQKLALAKRKIKNLTGKINLPNGLKNTLLYFMIGMTVGGLVGAGVAMVVGGPFTLIGLCIGGLLFLVFGFVRDVYREYHSLEGEIIELP